MYVLYEYKYEFVSILTLTILGGKLYDLHNKIRVIPLYPLSFNKALSK